MGILLLLSKHSGHTQHQHGEGQAGWDAQEAHVRLLPLDERRGEGRGEEGQPRRQHHLGVQGVWSSLAEYCPAVKAKYEKKKDEAKKAFDKNYAAWLADGGEELLAQQKKDKKAGKKPAAKPAKKTKKKKKAESSEDEK